MAAMPASRREIEYKKRSAGIGFQIFRREINACRFNLEVQLCLGTISKSVSAERRNRFLKFSILFFLFFNHRFALFQNFFPQTLTNRLQSIVRKLELLCRVARLGAGIF